MANEIHIDYSSSSTIYVVIRNSAGQVWNPAGMVFENWGTNGRDASDYAMSLIDKGGSRYVGDFDADIPTGRYSIQSFLQAGDEPEDDDTLIGVRAIIWRETAN